MLANPKLKTSPNSNDFFILGILVLPDGRLGLFNNYLFIQQYLTGVACICLGDKSTIICVINATEQMRCFRVVICR